MDGAHEASTIGSWPAGSIANSPPPFLNKTYDMVDDPATDLVVSWSNGNNSFVVWSVPEFERDLLPKYFKHNNFASFIRQLNTYGFKKVDPDRWEFANEGFLRGQKHLLKSISRRKAANAHGHEQPPPVQGTSVGSCVEVGKLEIEEDVEWLKRDKNVLMQELVRLRQQQQATDHQLQTAGQRIQVMEQRQQQMMSFLAKAMQSPGFLAQLVQQQNESKRQISGVNKKRRLPKQEEEISVSNHVNASPDGQMVKYQPQLNEAAKAMLRQILKMNAPVRLEPTIKNSNGFLIDDVHSQSKGWDGDGFSCGISEVLPASAESYFSAESNFPSSCPSAAFSEIHSSADVVSDPGKVAQFPEMNVLNPPEGSISPQFSQIQGIMPGSSVEVAEEIFAGHETQNSGYIDNTLDLKNEAMPIVGDEFFPDPDVDIMLDDIPKLPGINDVFWEQFLSASPLSGDSDEITSEAQEGGIRNEQEVEVNGWEKIQHMNHLTEQMGLLASEARRR